MFPTDASDKNDDVDRALGRYQAVDGLLLRPKLGNLDAALSAGQNSEERKIALLAHQELEQSIRNTPADPTPYLQLAKIYQSQNRWKDTLRVLDSGVQHNPEYEPLVIFREDFILEAAERIAEEARQAHLNHPSSETQIHLERCETSLANERIQFCSHRLKRHPDQKELLIIWGAALKQLDRSEEAIGLLEKAAQHRPLRARAWLELGLCQQQLNRPIEALSAFRKAAMFRAPPPEPALRLQALTLAFELADRLGMIASAINYAKLLIEANVPQADRLVTRIEILKRQFG